MKTIAIGINEVIRDYIRQFAVCYQKGIDGTFKIDYDDVKDFDLTKSFPFINEDDEPDRSLYDQFRYEDYAFELHARADLMERDTITQLNLWINNTLRNFGDDKNPKVMIVGALECYLTLPSTLSFLAAKGLKAREFYFPEDSYTIWDRCDILITANPNLIQICPEGKYVIKINAPYNTDVHSKYEYDSIKDVIYDDKQIISKIIEGKLQEDENK